MAFSRHFRLSEKVIFMALSCVGANICAPIFGSGVVASAESGGRARDALDPLVWLLGTWEYETETQVVSESWSRSGLNTFLGAGFSFKPGQPEPYFEEVMFLADFGGEIFYLVKTPQNPLPIAFKLTDTSANRAVFDNPAHDFPKQLEYQLDEEGVLSVHVSDGANRGFTYHFRKRKENE